MTSSYWRSWMNVHERSISVAGAGANLPEQLKKTQVQVHEGVMFAAYVREAILFA